MLNNVHLSQILQDIHNSILQNIQTPNTFSGERDFNEWFYENYSLCGFDAIKERFAQQFPDYIMLKDGFEIRVELEVASSNFIAHRHDPAGVDVVLCLWIDKPISVPVIEILPFDYKPDVPIHTVKVDPNAKEIIDCVRTDMRNSGISSPTSSAVIRKLGADARRGNKLCNLVNEYTNKSISIESAIDMLQALSSVANSPEYSIFPSPFFKNPLIKTIPKRISPRIKNSREIKGDECSYCHSTNTISHGSRLTLNGLQVRRMCNDCGHTFSINKIKSKLLSSGVS